MREIISNQSKIKNSPNVRKIVSSQKKAFDPQITKKNEKSLR